MSTTWRNPEHGMFVFKTSFDWAWGETFGYHYHGRQPDQNTTSGEYLVVLPIFTHRVTVHLFTKKTILPRGVSANEMTRKLFGACSPVYTPDNSVRPGASSNAIPSCVSTHCTKVYAFALPFTLLFPVFSPLLTLTPPFF